MDKIIGFIGDFGTEAALILIQTMNIAGDRPPRYDEKNATPSRRARACPSPRVWIPAALITPVGQDRQILPRFGLWRARTTESGPMPSSIRLSSKAGYIPKRR